MRDSVESYFKVNHAKEDSVGLLLVELNVDKVEELHQVVCDGRAFKTTALTRIDKRL